MDTGDVKSQASASISPDKGDHRIGVSMQTNGHRVWMTRSATQRLILQLTRALADADGAVKS